MHFWQLVLEVIPNSNIFNLHCYIYQGLQFQQSGSKGCYVNINQRPQIKILLTSFHLINRPRITKSFSIFAGILPDFVRYLDAAKAS